MTVFVPVPYCFDYCSFVVWHEVRGCDSSSSVRLPQDFSVGFLGSFVFSYKFKIFCSSYVKNAIGILIGIALNLYIALVDVVISTILILPIMEEHDILVITSFSLLYLYPK